MLELDRDPFRHLLGLHAVAVLVLDLGRPLLEGHVEPLDLDLDAAHLEVLGRQASPHLMELGVAHLPDLLEGLDLFRLLPHLLLPPRRPLLGLVRPSFGLRHLRLELLEHLPLLLHEHLRLAQLVLVPHHLLAQLLVAPLQDHLLAARLVVELDGVLVLSVLLVLNLRDLQVVHLVGLLENLRVPSLDVPDIVSHHTLIGLCRAEVVLGPVLDLPKLALLLPPLLGDAVLVRPHAAHEPLLELLIPLGLVH
mmetsp:Transcript_81376/g.230982  ORF Transcript_81376/g.230982 Transcript_81376/m.230982 type:complete len:251 (-) Transcript_81376:589-1341(-)